MHPFDRIHLFGGLDNECSNVGHREATLADTLVRAIACVPLVKERET